MQNYFNVMKAQEGYTIQRGDTLGAIARRYGRSVKQLMQWNSLKNANSLRIGQRLRVSPK